MTGYRIFPESGSVYPERAFTTGALEGSRPVVVIDPEDAEQVHRLRELIWREDGTVHIGGIHNALREFASPTPPKPVEPQGLGAVVEDAHSRRWIRSADDDCTKPWSRWCSFDDAEYADIDVVRVLSEGVTS